MDKKCKRKKAHKSPGYLLHQPKIMGESFLRAHPPLLFFALIFGPTNYIYWVVVMDVNNRTNDSTAPNKSHIEIDWSSKRWTRLREKIKYGSEGEWSQMTLSLYLSSFLIILFLSYYLQYLIFSLFFILLLYLIFGSIFQEKCVCMLFSGRYTV